MVKCAICKDREATQTHHIKYDPEIVIDVCVPCHLKLHEHGVGKGKGELREEKQEKQIEEEVVPFFPTYTKMIELEGIKYVVTIEDEEILTIINCPNDCKHGWQVLGTKDKQLILRCPFCGWDTKIMRMD